MEIHLEIISSHSVFWIKIDLRNIVKKLVKSILLLFVKMLNLDKLFLIT